MATVQYQTDGPVAIVTINRPEVRNAVDGPTASALREVFLRFEADDALSAAVLTGRSGNFCAGFDLKTVAVGSAAAVAEDGEGPMGPTRLFLSKPVIAAVEGHAVAGGLELALWCDLRVAAEGAIFGVFCRRWGVPLIDGGTVRLPRLIGHSHALDMILTGRPVAASEALGMGLANRVVPNGKALAAAVGLAAKLALFPQGCLRSDRLSAHEQWDLDLQAALRNEARHGIKVIASGETREGAARFAQGAGRHGSFEQL
jgi:enoyl-CoA hydratase